MSITLRLLTVAAGATLLAVSAAAVPAGADEDVKPVTDKLEFVEAADGIKPFGVDDPGMAIAGAQIDSLTVEIPDGYAWRLPDKGEKFVLEEPAAAVE